MQDLLREIAPIDERSWEEIETLARETLSTYLAARRLVDVEGPIGWDRSSVNTGRVDALERSPEEGVDARSRVGQPLQELRAPFSLDRDALEAASRGAEDPDLDPLVEACRRLARAENRMVFHGYDAAGVEGLCEGCDPDPIESTEGFADYPRLVSSAINVLRQEGVGGPYALALGPDAYTGLADTGGAGGYPVIEHVLQLLEGPVIWAPALEGALVASRRGGDFELTLGRDISIGYHDHDTETVELYLVESVTFRLLGPEAAVTLRPMGSRS